MTIVPNSVVTLTYKLHTVENGTKTFVEEAGKDNPLDFLYGVGMMLPKFEENIAGLEPGDTTDFELAAEDAYGEVNELAIASLPAEMFQEAVIHVVAQVLPLQYNQGGKCLGEETEGRPVDVVVDRYLPIAGH